MDVRICKRGVPVDTEEDVVVAELEEVGNKAKKVKDG